MLLSKIISTLKCICLAAGVPAQLQCVQPDAVGRHHGRIWGAHRAGRPGELQFLHISSFAAADLQAFLTPSMASGLAHGQAAFSSLIMFNLMLRDGIMAKVGELTEQEPLLSSTSGILPPYGHESSAGSLACASQIELHA